MREIKACHSDKSEIKSTKKCILLQFVQIKPSFVSVFAGYYKKTYQHKGTPDFFTQ